MGGVEFGDDIGGRGLFTDHKHLRSQHGRSGEKAGCGDSLDEGAGAHTDHLCLRALCAKSLQRSKSPLVVGFVR